MGTRQLEILHGGAPFGTSIAGFVTLSGRIDAVTHHSSTGAICFAVDTDIPEVQTSFSHRRFPVHCGGPALKIGSL